MPRVSSFYLLIGCLLLSAPLAAQTQITTGVIQGTVMDSTGAVLPGVDVTIVNPETNLTQSRTTDTDGRFVFLQLPPGRYTATFRLSGFGTVHPGEHRAHSRPGGQSDCRASRLATSRKP